jgi:hypothetical protein
MFLQWLTDGDLGVYSLTHSFSDPPLIIQYNIEIPPGQVTLVSGSLPNGLSWRAEPNYIYITGTIAAGGLPGVYRFTLRITGIDDTYLDREFVMQVLSSPVPLWLSPSNQGTFPESYSFDLHPVTLRFAAVDPARVRLINGSLPAGLSWRVSGQSVVITGESLGIDEPQTSTWTFRLTNPNGTVSDRTFRLALEPAPVLPSWANQAQFLGYVGSGMQAMFRVRATGPTGEIPTYSLVEPIADGLSIDAVNGLVTYQAPTVSSDTTTALTVRATLPDGSADLQFGILVLTIPHVPVWTSDFTSTSVAQGQHLSLDLQAFDPSGAQITYSIYSAPADFPFFLDADGLLYGKAPRVTEDRQWQATILASSINGGSYLYLTILVTKNNAPGVLVWRNESTELVDAEDGRRACYDIGAVSSRTVTVKHGIVGGQCPPGMILDKIQGQLVGYLDYHPTDKDYWFDVTATDGVDTLTRKIYMRVKATRAYQFASIDVPIWGDLKDRWLSVNNFVMTKTSMTPNVSVQSSFFAQPSLSLIRGLDSTILDPEEIIADVMPALSQMRLSIGSVGNVVIDDQDNSLIYRNVIDPQQGAATIAENSSVPPLAVRPPSLENLRGAFADACGFATGGLGEGAAAMALVDPERGEISSIKVVAPGSAYVYVPQISIKGSGRGARAAAHMRVVDIRIVDRGEGWVLGESVFLDTGLVRRPAELVVSGVTPTGGLLSLLIVDGGSYQQVPIGKRFIENQSGNIASLSISLGVDAIEVIDPGIGYQQETLQVMIGGMEILEDQDVWSPRLPMALVTAPFRDLVLYNSQLTNGPTLDGFIWQVGDLIHSIEGLYWQGTTSFDGDLVSWDGSTTRFQEILEPRETLLDQGDCSFDLADTTLDRGPMIRSDARANWGRTLIDDGMTAFDFYATIFDANVAPTESTTKIKRLIKLWKPQISGYNATDHR